MIPLKYLLLYNPVSGKGKFKQKIAKIEAIFSAYGQTLDIYESKFQGDLINVSYNKAKDYDVFLVAGGDGTLHEVLNGVMREDFDKRPCISILPYGTANDSAAILGITKNLKKTIVRTLIEKPILVDINRANAHYFIYTLAAGVLTKISYDVSRTKVKKYGYLAYFMAGVKDIFKRYRLHLDITHDHGHVKDEYLLVLALSGNRVGGMFLNKFSKSKLNDGLLEMRLIKTPKLFRVFKVLYFFISFGRKFKQDVHLQSSFYSIKAPEDVVWNTDGEKIDCGDIEIKVHKEAIRMFVSNRRKKKYFY